MSLTTLAAAFRTQASASGGYITIDSTVLTNAGFKPQDGLDTLLTAGFCLATGKSLQVNTTGQTIPDPVGDNLTIQGKISIASISITEANTSVTIVFSANGTAISFVIATQLINWEFKTSFPYMVGYPFDQLPYTDPYFVFSTADVSSYTWLQATINLVAGQNFASNLTLTNYLKPIVSFLTSWDANAKIPFFGSIEIDKVDNENTLYPEADWKGVINAQMQPLSFLKIGNPFVHLVIETITDDGTGDDEEENIEDGVTEGTAVTAEPETEQNPQFYFGMSLEAGPDIQLDFTVLWMQDNKTITIATTSTPGKELTAMNLINLMAGQNYLGFIPPTMQQFLRVFAFKVFTVTMTTDTKKISRLGATIGSTGEWQLFSDFTITEFDFVWTVLNPATQGTSLFYFESEFEFFPNIFKNADGTPGLFYIKINNQLQFSGNYKGSVLLNDIVSGITNGAIVIPANIASVSFSDFFIYMDVPNKTYRLGATTDIELNIITNIAIKNTTFTINSSTPATGQGDPKFSANIDGTFILGVLYLDVKVDYSKTGNDSLWKLDVSMPSDKSINLGDLMKQMFQAVNLPSSFLPDNLLITQFSTTAEIPGGDSESSYEVKAGFQWDFTFPIINQPIDILANLWIKYEGKTADDKTGKYSGGVLGSITLKDFNATVDIGYNFSANDQQLMIRWEGFVTTYNFKEESTGKPSRIIKFSIENWSVGGLITSFMKMLFNPTFELDAPWDILNDISLDGFSVTYNLDSADIEVTYKLPKSINLVFITINGINFTKNKDGVFLTIDGSSVVPGINDSNLFKPEKGGQDVTKMPEVPGQGTEYFELRLLAMGQHIELTNASQYKSIKDVTEAMQKAFTEPESGKIPICPGTENSLLNFNEDSNWLIATNLGILNVGTKEKPVWTVDMQVVFNDPNLYGLRIALSGAKAKVLAGLDFEIMYKKISDSVGVYQIELTLPDALRNLQFGAVNITLPSIGLQIYTNGDFMVDIGFPYNMDFSRSFTVQAIVPPGIPAMGSGGFYFGKLSSATTNKVPATNYGNFNPVIVFGIGLQVGVGYSVNYGILSAGFSLTLFGIIEGVIATYHPYAGALQESNQQVVETSYYYYLQGTIGIIGKLYGSIDFGIISASVNITVMVYAQATFEAYHKIPLAIVASVDVKVSARLNLGIFKITIHFSFTAHIRQDVTIGTDRLNEAPWNKNLGGVTESFEIAAQSLAMPEAMMAVAAPQSLSFRSMLIADAGTELQTLNIYFVPHLTVAGPEHGSLNSQQAQYVATLFTDAPDPTTKTTEITSFEYLCADFFTWLILNYNSAASPVQATRSTVDKQGISKDDLNNLLALLSNKDNPFPIPTDQILTFLQTSFKAVNIQQLPKDLPSAAIFPMLFDLELNVPGIPLDIHFSEYNKATTEYLTKVKEWFAELAVSLQENPATPKLESVVSPSYSLSTFVFEDYFVLIGKQLTGYATDAMDNFTYNLTKNPNSLQGMVNWANSISVDGNVNSVAIQDVATANQAHPLTGGLPIAITGQSYQVATGDNFASIAARYALAPAMLITQNGNVPGLLGAQTLKFNGNSYVVKATDTMNLVAAGLKTTLPVLAADSVFQQSAVITANVWLIIGAAIYSAKNEDTFASVASTVYNKLDVSALLLQNQVTPGLFIAGNSFVYNGTTYTIVPGDTLAGMAAKLSTSASTVTPQDLAANSQVQALNIQPLGQVLIQPFNYATAGFTEPANADTLESVAAKFNTTAALLAANYANQQLNNLFYSGTGYTNANVPGLQYLDVNSILQYFTDNGSYGQLSGMVSRYQLHGMRLPTNLPGLTLSPGSPCPADGNCALFSLTGQQFALPANVAVDFSIQLVNNSLAWLQFNGVKKPDKDPATLEIKLKSNDITQITTLLTYAQKTGVQPEVTQLAPMKPYNLLPVQYTFQTTTKWQTSGILNLPYGSLGSQATASPLIWEFPSGMMKQLALPKLAGSKFSIQVGQYNAEKGVMDYNPSTYYGWNTMVEIELKKQADAGTSGVSAYTYELLGATEAGAVILEQLLLALDAHATDNNKSKIIDIQWLYEGGDGLMSVGMSSMKSFIVQANLSTETNPSQPGLEMMMAVAEEEPATTTGILNSTYDFIRLLWECSITRSGGYYLLYNEIESNAGFPDTIFGKGDTASIRLMVTYSSQYNNKPATYMNCAVTGDKIDTSSCVVYAESAVQKNITVVVRQPSDTLSAITSGYNIILSELAGFSAGIVLNTSVKPYPVIQLTNLVYEAGKAGAPNSLASIVKYYNVDGGKVQALNPGIPDWNNLPPWQLIRIPEVNYDLSTGTAGNTLAKIAAYYFIDIATLAWAAKDVQNLFSINTQLTINDQVLHKVSSIPQGTAGFELQRNNPGLPPAVTDANYAKIYLSNLYNLLSYQVVGNAWFNESIVGLPVGPGTSQSQDDLLGKTTGDGTDGPWIYNQVVPVAQYSKPNSYMKYPAGYPQEKDNPYRGIGQQVQVHFDWVDYYGNNTITPFSNPGADPLTPLNNPPIQVGYTDELKGLGKWPSVDLSYLFDTGVSKSPELQVNISFSDKRYIDIPDVPPQNQQDWKQNAANDLLVYTNIYYQLTQLNPENGNNTVTITLSTSLTPGKQVVLSGSQLDQLLQLVKDAYTYLTARSQGNNASVPATQQIVTPVNPADIDTASIVQLNVNIDFARDLAYVNNDFKDSSLVTRAGTAVIPQTASGVQSNGSSQTGLSNFAQKFEAAFASQGNYILKIATGTNSVTAGSSKNSQAVFVVRMGQKPGQGIYWSITQAGVYQLTSQSISQLTTAGLPPAIITALTKLVGIQYKDRDTFDTALNAIMTPAEFKQYSIAVYTYSLLNPVFYAPKPLATSLISKPNVPICRYVTGAGLDCSANATKNFTGIDMDVWGAQSLNAIDVFFASDFSVPAFFVDLLKAADEKTWLQKQNIDADTFVEAITNAKKNLSDVISGNVEPILTAPYVPVSQDENSSLGNAKKQFEQQLLNELGNAYSINALVQLKVHAQSDFVPAGDNKTPPRLYGVPVINNQVAKDNSEYSISNAKVQLNAQGATTDDSYLTFTFTTKNAKDATAVLLNLTYVVTHIEFEITDVPGIEGYQGSNWLTFIIPADINNPVPPAGDVLQQSIGTLDIPVVLRNYPTPPTLTTQDGKAVPVTGDTTAQRLAKASEWNYVYAYTEDQVAQDKIFSDIEFGMEPDNFGAMVESVSRDLFSDMAQLVTVWPQVLEDFNKYLTAITATSIATDPNLQNAYFALQTLVTLTNNLSIAWSQFKGEASLNAGKIAGTKRNYDFMIQQAKDENFADRLRLTITPPDQISAQDRQILGNNQSAKPVVLPEIPYVSIDDYDVVPAKDDKGKIIPNAYWFQVPKSKPASYLSWNDAAKIPSRTVNVDDLNVLQYQYAWAGLSVIRNEDLVPDNPTVNDFIYRTPLVKFSNKLIPLLNSGDQIDIAKIKNEAGQTLPLAQQLANFLQTFFSNDALKTQMVKLSVTWNYTLLPQANGPLSAIQLPILLATPFDFAIPGDYTIPAGGCQATFSETDPFVCRLANALKTWYAQSQPVTQNAWFQFDISVFSSLTESRLPLIELSDVVLYFKNINDMN